MSENAQKLLICFLLGEFWRLTAGFTGKCGIDGKMKKGEPAFEAETPQV
jgi:hypothetical protein